MQAWGDTRVSKWSADGTDAVISLCLSLRGSLVLQNECKHQDALLLCSTSSSRYDTYRQTAAQTDRPQKPSACGETLRSTCCCSGGETERKRETDRTGASVMSCEIQLYTHTIAALHSVTPQITGKTQGLHSTTALNQLRE